MRGDIQPLVRKLLYLVRLFADDDGHFDLAHPVDSRREFVALLLGVRLVALFDKQFLLLVPIVLHLVVHLDGGELVDAHDHPLAEKAPAREMVRNVAGDFVEAVFALDDLKNAAGRVFEKFAFAVVKILLFDDLNNIVIEEVVCEPDFRDTARIEKRNGRTVGYRLGEVVLAHVVAEPLICEPLRPKERRTRKCNVVGIRQPCVHVLRELLVLCAVGFVDKNDDVFPIRKDGIPFLLVPAELMDEGEKHRLVARQKLAQLLRRRRAALVLLPHHLGSHESLVYLIVEVLSVGDDKEGEVAGHLPLHLPYKHHHRIALARSLRMPEHAQLAVQLLAVLHRAHQVVHAQELMVLRNDLHALLIEEHEVLDVVEKPLLLEEPVNENLN